jgi:3-hydroxyacyl-[acyl-carrier-protein] dehydratase
MRFLLVDRILEMESGRRATGIKNVTMSEEFLAYHFPDRPIMPGALITESLVQLADWIVRESSDFQQMGLPMAFDRLKFRRFVRPGDQLFLEAEITSHTDSQVAVRGRALCQEQQMVTAAFTLALYPMDDFHTVEEARRHYRILCGVTE